MKGKTITLLVTACFILLAFLPMTTGAENKTSQTIYVDDDNIDGPWDGSMQYPFISIQEGINAASPEDTIFIFDGLYQENIVIDRTLSIIGESQENTVIYPAEGRAISINANNVTLSNFCIDYPTFYMSNGGCYLNQHTRNISIKKIYFKYNTCHSVHAARLSGPPEEIIIENNLISSAFGITGNGRGWIIKNNIFSDAIFAINCVEADFLIHNNLFIKNDEAIREPFGCKIFDNIFIDNNVSIELRKNNEIYNNEMIGGGFSGGGSGNALENNTVNGIPIIYLENKKNMSIEQQYGQVILTSCQNITVKNQNINDTNCGIGLNSCSNCRIHSNSFSGCNSGISLCSSDRNTLENNNVSNCNYGIRINYQSDHDIVKNNHLTRNTIGVGETAGPLDYTNSNSYISNLFEQNDLAIEIQGSLTLIINNNFFNNQKDANYVMGGNLWLHNYWDRPHFLPKPIIGAFGYPLFQIPWIIIDFLPALQPNEIGT